MILNRKVQEAREAGIAVRCECDDMRGLILTTMEICALFANLLDNAIEANKRCPEGEGRKLDIECRKREKMLLIKIQNRIAEKEVAKGIHILETTEKNKKEHGFGMRSIQKVVDSYGGDISADIRKEVFKIEVVLAGFAD